MPGNTAGNRFTKIPLLLSSHCYDVFKWFKMSSNESDGTESGQYCQCANTGICILAKKKVLLKCFVWRGMPWCTIHFSGQIFVFLITCCRNATKLQGRMVGSLDEFWSRSQVVRKCNILNPSQYRTTLQMNSDNDNNNSNNMPLLCYIASFVHDLYSNIFSAIRL